MTLGTSLLVDRQAAFVLNVCGFWLVWLSTARSRFYFTRYAFLLSAETKHALIQSGARIEQSMAQQHALAEALMTGVMYPYLVISVERQHLLQHALVALSRVSDSDLKKPLKVIFIGEEGVDEGGVRKEFFQLLVAQVWHQCLA